MSARILENDPKLKIKEIFYSIQGEASFSGWPTVFVRLTGCPLRCVYCDTAYAFQGGDWMDFDQIVSKVDAYACPRITITGGEPLAQKNSLALMTVMCDRGWQVSLETSGAIDISEVDPRVCKVLDIKTPGSGEAERHLDSNHAYLTSQDQIKFVICDHDDYTWCKQKILRQKLDQLCTVWLSPSAGQMSARSLAEWILADQLPVRLQIQLHKVLWGDEPGR